MKTWNDWAGSAALPYLLRAHKAPRALLIHAGAEADAILAAAVDALALGFARALALAGGRSEWRSEDRAAFARDAVLDLDLTAFDGCAAVAVPWTPDAPKPPRMIHAALERALRSTCSAAQPVLVRVDAAALPANAAGVDAVANALPDFTQARVILSTVSAGRPPALAGYVLPRSPAASRRVLPLLLGAARLASDAPGALFHVQIRVPSRLLAVRGEPFPVAEIADAAASPLRCNGIEIRAGGPQNAQERAGTPPTGNPAPGSADAPQGPSPRRQRHADGRSAADKPGPHGAVDKLLTGDGEGVGSSRRGEPRRAARKTTPRE